MYKYHVTFCYQNFYDNNFRDVFIQLGGLLDTEEKIQDLKATIRNKWHLQPGTSLAIINFVRLLGDEK